MEKLRISGNVIQTVLAHTLPGLSESGCSLAPGMKNVPENEICFIKRYKV